MLSSMPNERTNERRNERTSECGFGLGAISHWRKLRVTDTDQRGAARRTDVTGDSSLRQVFAETAKSVIQWPELKLKLILA